MNKEFNKGLLLAGFGSFWWGFFGVLYFKYITFIGHIELVVHRCLWTTFTLVITTFFFSGNGRYNCLSFEQTFLIFLRSFGQMRNSTTDLQRQMFFFFII